MTNPQSTQTQKNNATCWFEHYLTCGGSCGSSPCNGTDPFRNPCSDG
jgi:hypothetical protein